MKVHLQLRIWETFNAEIYTWKLTKPSLSSCIQFFINHKPVVSYRHHSYGQLIHQRLYSLLKKVVCLSKRDPPHRRKARHVSNSHPLVNSCWRWRQTRSESVGNLFYSLFLLINGTHVCNNQTILCAWYCRDRVSSCNIYTVQQDTRSF